MAKILLIDGNNLFHRAYHALPPLTGKDGENSNAVYGFSNMLLKAIDEVKPDYVACAFDTAAPTFRHVAFEKYKAQRPSPPPDLYPQLPKVKNVLKAFGVPYFEKAGYEADDILATIAMRAVGPFILEGVERPIRELVSRKLKIGSKSKAKKDSIASLQNDKVDDVVILSGDRDVLQLVDGFIKVQMPGWNLTSTSLYGRKEVIAKFGIEPRQMVDYKSLVGDASDNVPGVAGIGPKTASGLLQKYDNLETLYERLDEVPPKVAEKLRAGRQLALEAKGLVVLDTNVDLEFEIGNLEYSPDWDKVRREFEELGFKSILAKLPGGETTKVSKVTNVSKVSKEKNKDQLELI